MSIELSEVERLRRAVECLRLYIRDKKELNRLLLGEFESDDSELRMAIVMALEDWNNTPPPIGRVTLVTHPAKHLLLMGAALHALRGAGLWHSREHMPSSDGGTSADDHAKAGEYQAWISAIAQEYETKKQDYKVSANINAALNGMSVPSEYSWFWMYGDNLSW